MMLDQGTIVRGAGIAAVVALMASSAGAQSQQIIFADIFTPDFASGSIRRVNYDGSGLVTLVNTGGGLRTVDVDHVNGKMYWADVDQFAIRRSNLNGSNMQDVVNIGLVFPSALAVDGTLGMLYWGDQSLELVFRCELDGSFPQEIEGTPFHRGIALDTINGKMYWSTSLTPTQGEIMRANLDGTAPEVVVPVGGAAFKPGSLAIDAAGGKIYWSDQIAGVIRRANVDGTGMETLFTATGGGSPRGIALDLVNQAVVWGEEVNEEGVINGSLKSGPLEGGLAVTVITGLGLVNDVVVVAAGGCPADWNGDETVNSSDISAFLTSWLGSVVGGDLVADFNGDLVVNSSDISAFLTAWLAAVAGGC